MYGVLDDEDGLLGECDIDDTLSFCGQVGENGNAQEKQPNKVRKWAWTRWCIISTQSTSWVPNLCHLVHTSLKAYFFYVFPPLPLSYSCFIAILYLVTSTQQYLMSVSFCTK
jgi:hypothetical protein